MSPTQKRGPKIPPRAGLRQLAKDFKWWFFGRNNYIFEAERQLKGADIYKLVTFNEKRIEAGCIIYLGDL